MDISNQLITTQRALEEERVQLSEAKKALDVANVEISAVKGVTEILFDIAHQMGAIVDSLQHRETQKTEQSFEFQQKSFDLLLGASMVKLDLQKAEQDNSALKVENEKLKQEISQLKGNYDLEVTEEEIWSRGLRVDQLFVVSIFFKPIKKRTKPICFPSGPSL